MSHHSGFEIDGELLVLTSHAGHGQEKVIISEEGELEINGERIQVDRDGRKLLRKFFRESVRLEEKADLIAEDAQELASEATALAAVSVLRALRSLGNEDGQDQEELSEFTAEFEGQADVIEKLGDEIGDQATLLKELAEELQERIPELDQVEWFMEN